MTMILYAKIRRMYFRDQLSINEIAKPALSRCPLIFAVEQTLSGEMRLLGVVGLFRGRLFRAAWRLAVFAHVDVFGSVA